MTTAAWPGPVPIAHRGSRYLWPENTLEAFSAAIELGLDHIETDLRMTADGQIVCLHDESVTRTTGAPGLVSEMTYREVAALDAGFRHFAGSGFPFRGGGVRIPRFEDVVAAFPGIKVVADLKADGMASELSRLVARHALHDRLIVGSFRDTRLGEVRRASAGLIATSTGSAETRRWVLASRMGRTVPTAATALQVPVQMRGMRVVDDRLVGSAHAAGLAVHVWTVNRPGDMTRLLDLGVDGLVTDRPDLLRQVMEERGSWPA
jgi:glycerophosphoryl diester phosphodiesterase